MKPYKNEFIFPKLQIDTRYLTLLFNKCLFEDISIRIVAAISLVRESTAYILLSTLVNDCSKPYDSKKYKNQEQFQAKGSGQSSGDGVFSLTAVKLDGGL